MKQLIMRVLGHNNEDMVRLCLRGAVFHPESEDQVATIKCFNDIWITDRRTRTLIFSWRFKPIIYPPYSFVHLKTLIPSLTSDPQIISAPSL